MLNRLKQYASIQTLRLAHVDFGGAAMKTKIKEFIREEKGATAIEYGLIASLIAVAIIVGAKALGSQINNTFNEVANKMANP
jgi:pilus assembly protein Flp/PilA